jgi:hypothetical protein
MKTERLSPLQVRILYFFKGTGRYVGKDAMYKGRNPGEKFKLRSLAALRRKRLLEYFACNEWYLTEIGRDLIRGGIDATASFKIVTDEHYNKWAEIRRAS